MCLNVDGHEIKRLKNTKFLGVHIDEYLNFKYHIEQLTKK